MKRRKKLKTILRQTEAELPKAKRILRAEKKEKKKAHGKLAKENQKRIVKSIKLGVKAIEELHDVTKKTLKKKEAAGEAG